MNSHCMEFTAWKSSAQHVEPTAAVKLKDMAKRQIVEGKSGTQAEKWHTYRVFWQWEANHYFICIHMNSTPWFIFTFWFRQELVGFSLGRKADETNKNTRRAERTSLEVWMQGFSVRGKVKLLLLNHERKCKTQVRICGEYDWTGGGGSPHLIIILGALESGHVPPCITAGQLIYLISSWSRQFTAVINVLVSSLYHNISIVCHFSSKLEQHSAPLIANLSKETAIKHHPIEWHQPKW